MGGHSPFVKGILGEQSTVHFVKLPHIFVKLPSDWHPSDFNVILSLGLMKLPSRYSMYMLVRMSQHVINNQDMGSYLGKTFGNCLIKVKRNFDKYIVSKRFLFI